jgi:hypothetical protein
MLFQDADASVYRTLTRLARVCPLWWSETAERPIDVAAINFNDGKGDILTLIFGDRDKGLDLLSIARELAPEAGVAAVSKADGEYLGSTWQITTNSCRAEGTGLPSLMGRSRLTQLAALVEPQWPVS